MIDKILSSSLKIERKRLGLTLQQMAEVGGVSRSSQVGYESAARVPDAAYLKKIASAGADVHFVLYGERLSLEGAKPFDWDLHDRVLQTIEDWLSERRLTISFEKRMLLLRLFLAHFALVERVDLDFIHQELKKVA